MKKRELFISLILVLSVVSATFAAGKSKHGCLTKPKENNGHCTTDGSSYFCENSSLLTSTNCVKGVDVVEVIIDDIQN